ncbi:LexA family transcriptional regulator [candidate division WWE3 bacterium]|jgi:DNA polymerase V|uniref:LexA family transcriptional regulator n=1 Tax=candidate division WWE3 bacterium TaxID=2053526 RepID=A0A3A4ZCT3_UNCKA|nr:MAG: LexA family transcriptional regulator [candidate division WWE3 bacterium]
MSPQATPKGFPSPAEDYKEKLLDLNSLLVKNPPATFFVRCKSGSMKAAGIFTGDVLIVDKSVKARNNSIVLAFLDGDFVVRRLTLKGKTAILSTDDGSGFSEEIAEGIRDFYIWGVVTYIIHKPGAPHD